MDFAVISPNHAAKVQRIRQLAKYFGFFMKNCVRTLIYVKGLFGLLFIV